MDRKAVRVTKNVKTVLVVEKNPDYTQSLVNQILLAGFKPIVAITGEGGLRIRRNPEADQVPIVAMSAFPHVKSRCLERGCNDFLLNPVKMIDLMTRIRKFLH